MKFIQRILLISTICFPAKFLMAQTGFNSVHREQQQYYQQYGFTSEKQFDKVRPSAPAGYRASHSKSACKLQYDVYGWHPFWMGTAYNNYDFSLLSTFSYFSYELNPNTGNYNTIHSWRTTNAITLAKSAGCRVELCVTNFGSANNATFLNNPTARQRLIDSLISLVNYRNADGVNIDFEGIGSSERDSLTAFMTDLSSQLKSAINGATVTMAVFSVDWGGVFDIPKLNPVVDKFIIMGYGYYYSGSGTAGPTGPLYSGQRWSAYNQVRSVNYYLKQGVTPSKLCLGLPYYGYEWETVSSTVPASTTGGFSSSRTYTFVRTNTSGNYSNKQFDHHSYTPYYIFKSGGNWRQAFVDDAYSLGRRLDMIKQKGIGGMGIWALGYDDGYTELWDMIKQKFTDCGSDICGDSIFDMGGPKGNYYNNEAYTFTIAPKNASKVHLSFRTFALEAGFDSLWIYDGNSTSAPLIGGFSGSSIPGTISASGNALTLQFYSDGATTKPGWHAMYYCDYDTIPPQTIVNVNGNWQTQDFTATFTDSDSGGSGLEKRYYQVIDFNGTEWRANYRNGFFSDNFDSLIHPEWTPLTGTWKINGKVLEQTDQGLGNTNIFAKLNQSLSNRYLYHWQGNISGTGTNKRAGFHYFCDDATQTNRGNSYFIWYREDDDKLQLYKVVNNNFTLVKDVPFTFNPNQWYDFKVIYDRISGETRAYVDNQLVTRWTDPSPIATGKFISLRSGNADYKVNNLKVYRSRYPSVTVKVGADTTNDLRYQNPNPGIPAGKVKSIVADSAGNLSVIDYKLINVDWTPPANIDTINDGLNAWDIDTVANPGHTTANWSASGDQHSGIARYWYSVGSTPGDTDLVGWTGNWLNLSAIDSVFKGSSTAYYYNVRAENGAGLLSADTTSDGQFEYNNTGISNTQPTDLQVYPNPVKQLCHVKVNERISRFVLLDQTGRIVQSRNDAGSSLQIITINMKHLPQGNYYLLLYSAEKVNTVKLIKQ